MSDHTRSTSRRESLRVREAIEAFRAGNPVLIHDFDSREGETDLVYPAPAITPHAVARLRNEAGGLVCVAIGDEVAEAFDLPFRHEAIDHPATDHGDLGYDDRSSFSLTVNHRDTRTGITDVDRAGTITALGRAAAAPGQTDFPAEFRIPGHVHILRAAPDLLADRKGHTELGMALAREAGRSPAVVVTEMLDDRTGDALSTDRARGYAAARGHPFVEGRELVEFVLD